MSAVPNWLNAHKLCLGCMGESVQVCLIKDPRELRKHCIHPNFRSNNVCSSRHLLCSSLARLNPDLYLPQEQRAVRQMHGTSAGSTSSV